MKKSKIFTGIIIFFLFISCFTFLIKTKAEIFSTTSSNHSVLRTNTNIGTTTYLNGYDVVATDKAIIFFNGNGSSIAGRRDIPISTGYGANGAYTTRIMAYNSTHLIAITGAGLSQSNGYIDVALKAMLYNTQNTSFLETVWFNSTALSHHANVGAYNLESPFTFDMALIYSNSVYYAIISLGMNWGASASESLTTVIKVASTGATVQGDTYGGSADFNNVYTYSYLNNATFWFNSATELNTIYLISYSGVSSSNYTIYKFNCVTPTLTKLFNVAYNYDGINVCFVDYYYNTLITGNAYYDVLFAHSTYGNAKTISIEFLRFNDTAFVNDWQTTFLDTNTFGNQARIYDFYGTSGVWGTGTLNNGGGYVTNQTSSAYVMLYCGQLAYIMGINFYMTSLNTISPTFSFAPTGAYRWNNGIHYFTTSNNIGGILSPYGYGNMIQIDYQNSIICSDYLGATNPATALSTTWTPTPINHDKWYIQPTQTGTYTLSQNSTYYVLGYLYISGTIQTSGSYSIWSTALGTTISTSYSTTLVTSAPIGTNGSILIPITYEITMQSQTLYRSYLVNVTSGSTTYSFVIVAGWYFLDNSGNALPSSYSGQNSGNTSPVSSTNIGYSPFTNYWAVLIIYIVFSLLFSLIAGKEGLLAGLIIATILCLIAGLIPLWTIIPIIVMAIVLLLDRVGVFSTGG